MVRLSKKERQDQLELLASLNQVNAGANDQEDNGKWGALNRLAMCVISFIIESTSTSSLTGARCVCWRKNVVPADRRQRDGFGVSARSFGQSGGYATD